MSMAFVARTRRHRLGLTFAAAIAFTAFAPSAAHASPQSPTEPATTPTETPTALTESTEAPTGPTEMPAPPEPEDRADAPRTRGPGFVLDKGTYTGFDMPGARVGTSPAGINSRGVIVGKYNDGTSPTGSGASEHGFIRGPRGRFTTVDVPDARSTALTRINDRGQMVGIYSNTTGRVGDDPNRRSFLLARGEFTTISVPDAVFTQAFGINNDSHVVGEFVDTSGTGHGFLWKKGRFTPIDMPGSAYTAALDINDRGRIVGVHVRDLAAEPLKVRGFVLDRGRYASFDAPDAAITFPFGINNKGQIVGGSSNDAAITSRGFLLRKGPKGPFTPIDFPSAPSTTPTGINNRGTIVGAYTNTDAGLPDRQPLSMMSEMWESMAFAQDLSEQRAGDKADKPKPKDTDQRKEKKEKRKARQPNQRNSTGETTARNRPPTSTTDGNVKEATPKPKTTSKPKTAERSKKAEQSKTAERSKSRRPSREDGPQATRARPQVAARGDGPEQRVFPPAPVTDRQPTSDLLAEEDTTIIAPASDRPSEPAGVIQIQASDAGPPEDLDQTAAVSPMTRMTTRGLAVAVPVAAAWLLVMTRRRVRGLGGLVAAPAVDEPQASRHSTGFWHGRRTPSGRRTVTCREPDAERPGAP
jgi:probable HAF family extracellular repeat protein